jgi:membrane fusion protein, heavy metal efflux system
MQKILTLIATLAACALLSYFLWTQQNSSTEEEEHDDHHHDFVEISEDQLKSHNIDMRKATAGTLQQIVRAPAKIVIASNRLSHVIPKAPGIVLTVQKNLGERVSANEILATLESKEMAEAKAAYLTAIKKEQLENSRFQREKSLFDKNISAVQDFYTAQHDWEEAMIEKELSHQKLCSLGLCDDEILQLPQVPLKQLRVYEVRSPIEGRVIAQHITPGELVTNEHELYVIADLSKVWAEINVFSQDRPQTKQGQPVTISTHEGQKVKAVIVYLSPIIDEETRTSLAIAEIINPKETWLPGTFVQAELTTEAVPVACMITKEAVQNVDGENVIFIAQEGGFAVRPIAIGKSDEKFYEVLSGLEPGETYACSNTFLLKADLKKDEAEHMD